MAIMSETCYCSTNPLHNPLTKALCQVYGRPNSLAHLRIPDTHCTAGWVSSTAGNKYAVEQRKIPAPIGIKPLSLRLLEVTTMIYPCSYPVQNLNTIQHFLISF